ncbi:MAG: IS1 family transposase [Thermodesulfobacteriota bacterium]|nr:IS1 family transposase [Thermodesulfobacteriota bacterium]
MIEPDEDEVIEVDEMWSFVFSSIFKVWIWVAIARHNRQVIAFVVGDRSKEKGIASLHLFILTALKTRTTTLGT